jgi:hypothetical protein
MGTVAEEWFVAAIGTTPHGFRAQPPEPEEMPMRVPTAVASVWPKRCDELIPSMTKK